MSKPKIKIYFVTYKDDSALLKTLSSFYDTGGEDLCSEVNIINNFGKLLLPSVFSKRVNVFDNLLRPDFSTGHLTRNWNQAIINGFKNINNPDCDIVIHSQNDVEYIPGWTQKLLNIHLDKKINFFATGTGDCFCSYTIDAIKNIGIWDERFCGIGYQEADYFNRAAFHDPNNTSINDIWHNRNLNPLAKIEKNRNIMNIQDIINFYKEVGICHKYSFGESTTMHKESMATAHKPSSIVFKNKFSDLIDYDDLSISLGFNKINKTIYSGFLKTSMLYPYFEKDILNREYKNYIN